MNIKARLKKIWDGILNIGWGILVVIAILLVLALLAVIGVFVYLFGGLIVMGLLGAVVIAFIIFAFIDAIS